MQVNNVQELEDRTVTFEGQLTGKEAAIVLSIGLNTLYANGMMKMIDNVAVSEVLHQEGNDTVQ